MKFGSRFATATAVVTLLCASMAVAQETQGRIRVLGEGRISVTPDLARMTLGVRAEDSTAADAMAAAAQQMLGVMQALTSENIAPTDIQTTLYSVQPIFEQEEINPRSPYQPPHIVGYSASSDLAVTLRDLGKIGAVVDAVVDAGGNSFSGVGFDVADRSDALTEARQAAVADAIAKATLFAGAANQTLGPVLSITESGAFDGGPQPVMMQESARFAIPVAPGAIEVTASVTIEFALTQ